jgi:hypothetical protein
MDEVYLKINGEVFYLWRAVDEHGVVLDILVQDRRNATAAKRFFKRLLVGLQYKPRKIVTDGLRSYGVAQREVLPGVRHRTSRYLNNRAENSQADATADATARTPDAALQVTRADPAVPFSARDDLWPLPSTAAPDDRQSVPPFTQYGLPGLAAGDVCPDGGVRSRMLRRAVKLAWPSNNVTMPSASLLQRLPASPLGCPQEGDGDG